MTATPPPIGAPTGPAKNQPAHLQRLGIAAAEELRKTVRAALVELFGSFLQQLPAVLRDKAGTSTDAAERQRCTELAQALPGETGRWLDTFVQQVDLRLIGGIVSETANHGERDSIALANIELRAEARHRKSIAELDTRMDRIRLHLYVPIYTKALAPAGLCRALQDTADTLAFPGTLRRLLFETFDSIVIGGLTQLYQSLFEALKLIGTAAARAAAEPPAPAPATPASGTAAAPAAPQPAPAPLPPLRPAATPAPAVDTSTQAMLERFAARGDDGLGYSDSKLASELLALADNKAVPGVDAEQRWVPLQRMSLAGRFLSEAIADPFIPEALRPQHEAVRFPMVKSALADATLFTSATHPLGTLVNDLLLKSATSRITGNAEARRMAELLQQVLVQFDLAPDFVRQAMVMAKPIDEAQIQRFFEMKRLEAQQRREHVINEAKRRVARELELSSFGRDLPASALEFLNKAWGPLLVKRLLQYGHEHEQWTSALGMMEQLIDQLDAREPGPPPPEWQQLMQQMADALARVGLPPERIGPAIDSLEAARQQR